MSLYELERNGDVQELVGVLRESDNDRIRARAAELLGNFPDHRDRRDVVRALVTGAQDDDERVAANAVDALEELGGDALERLLADVAGLDLEAVDDERTRARAFARVLSADRPEIRMAAANALGDLGREDALEALVDRFEDPDPRVRARAARACGDVGDPRAVDGLRTLFGDASVRVRREAAAALGRIGDESALEALLPLYRADDERVRRVAVDAFGNFENGRPVAQLCAATTDESAAVRRTAVYSLIEVLGNAPTDRSHEIRERIVEELTDVDDAVVLEPLVEILERSSEPTQRRNAAWFLGRIAGDFDHRRVVDALVDALGDDDEELRQFAATSLGELGTDVVEAELVEVATDERRDADVRAQALFVLGTIGGEDARRTIDGLVDDTDDEFVRERALSAVVKLGGRLDEE